MAMRQKRMDKKRKHPSLTVKYSVPVSPSCVFSVVWRIYVVINKTELILYLTRGLKCWILNAEDLNLYSTA